MASYGGGGFLAGDSGAGRRKSGGGAVGGGAGGQSGPRTLSPLVPVTCKQLQKAELVEDKVMLGPLPATNVTVVAQVRMKQEAEGYVDLLLDDGTELVRARKWLDRESPEDQKELQDVTENSYVQVIGALLNQKSGFIFVARTVTLVNDMNQLSFHLAQCVESHLRCLKGGVGVKADPTAMTDGSFSVADGVGSSSFKSGKENMVFQLIRQCTAKQGMSLDDIYRSLEARITRQEIDDLIQDLVTKGLLYTTIDSNHYSAQ